MKRRKTNSRYQTQKAPKFKRDDAFKSQMEKSFDPDAPSPSDLPQDSGYHTRQQSAAENIIIPLGLQNPGWNCCYMNSTLQLLRSIKELVDFFLIGDAALIYNMKENVHIAKEFDDLLRAWQNNENLDEAHQQFRQKCGTLDQIWSNGGQQDSSEFLVFLLDTLSGDLKVGEYVRLQVGTNEDGHPIWNDDDRSSIIRELFQGTICSYRRCKECDAVHEKEVLFCILDVPMFGADTSVSALIFRFTARTDDGDQSMCSTCGVNVDTSTRTKITRYPKVLLICLKRYIADESLNFIKLNGIVKFDSLNDNYNLKAFVSHFGDSLNSGHYTSSVSFGGKFMKYSDASIVVLDDAVSSKECYIVAYQKPVEGNSILLGEFQWLEARRIALERNLTPLVRSNTIPIMPAVNSITKGLERLSSGETIRTLSQESIDKRSSIDAFSQENKDAAKGRWYEELGWEDEDINCDEFWEEFHHHEEEIERKWQVGDPKDYTLEESVEKHLENIRECFLNPPKWSCLKKGWKRLLPVKMPLKLMTVPVEQLILLFASIPNH